MYPARASDLIVIALAPAPGRHQVIVTRSGNRLDQRAEGMQSELTGERPCGTPNPKQTKPKKHNSRAARRRGSLASRRLFSGASLAARLFFFHSARRRGVRRVGAHQGARARFALCFALLWPAGGLSFFCCACARTYRPPARHPPSPPSAKPKAAKPTSAKANQSQSSPKQSAPAAGGRGM